MEPEKFIDNFAAIFDETDPSNLNMETSFRDIDEWSSLTALGLLAMVEEEYNVRLNNQDIKGATTIRDLYKIIQKKQSV
ncbi:MAG: acyl carrier protein [Chitinophagaceae bacterium]|nr:MAG: acyl carrier protein [Chitinophagaceae bacterium]